MNKKNSWIITLLLAALVPFATGCDDREACNDARNLQHGANNLSEMIQTDVNVAQNRAIDFHQAGKYELRCTKELELARTLNNDKTQKMLNEKKDDFCDEKGKSLGLCDAFISVRNGVNGRKYADDSDLTTRGLFRLLQEACKAQAAGGRLDIGNLNNGHSKDLKDDVEAIQQIFAGQVMGNAKTMADKVCKGTEPVAIVNAAITVKTPDSPGNYQTPINYSGPAKPDPQPQPPTQAPQPGEVPVVPPVTAPAAAPASAGSAAAPDSNTISI